MDKKKILWAFISLILAILTVWAIFAQSKNTSPAMIWQFIKDSNKFWLLCSGLCMIGFIWFEGYAITTISAGLGYKRRMRQGLLYGAADVYFSAITPSATGGQPASAFFMMKDGMPAPVVTVVLLINLIMYTLALLTLGVITLCTHFEIMLQFSLFSKVLIMIGIVVLASLAVFFYLLLLKPDLLNIISTIFMAILQKLRLVRFTTKRKKKLESMMEDYAVCSQLIVGKKKMLVKVFFWNIMQRLSQFGVSFTVFMATGSGLRKALQILFIQCFVSLGSNSVPIPGSMGVADYIMLDGFSIAIGEGQNAGMELLCRGISFYGCVVTGLLIVTIGFISRKLTEGKRC